MEKEGVWGRMLSKGDKRQEIALLVLHKSRTTEHGSFSISCHLQNI